MEDNTKKGARDISDLKARLGLKKTAVQQAASAPTGGEAAGQVPSPPGFQSPGGEGEPATAPEAQGPPPPDPRRDPFAATPMQPMYGYGMPLPGVDDGNPVTPISQPTAWGRVAGIGILVAVVLAGGFISGRSCKAREDYNMTTQQAGEISAEVDKLAKVLSQISDRINQSKEALAGNPDTKLAEDLAGLNLTEPDNKKLFHTNYYSLEDLAIDRLFNYYNDTIYLYKAIRENGKKTDGDKDAIERYTKDAAAKGDKNYGVILDGSQAIPVANLVEMGSLVCPKEGETNCAPDVMKFKYRVQSGGEWSQRPVKGKPNEVVTPIFRTPLFSQLASGNPDMLAAQASARRTAEIRLLVAKLMGEQKELLESLKRSADRPKVFTF